MTHVRSQRHRNKDVTKEICILSKTEAPAEFCTLVRPSAERLYHFNNAAYLFGK